MGQPRQRTTGRRTIRRGSTSDGIAMPFANRVNEDARHTTQRRNRDTCETHQNATMNEIQNARIPTRARHEDENAQRGRGELPRGSPPRSRRFGRREHSPKLLADHGLHERAVAGARRRPKPRFRTENLLAGAASVPIAILRAERLQRVLDLWRRLRHPRKRAANCLRGALLGLHGRNGARDGFPRFWGLYGPDSSAQCAGAFALPNLIGLRSPERCAWRRRRPG